MVRVKICGITNRDDALAAAGMGADALGFVFFKGSPRSVSLRDAAAIIPALPPYVTTVGVFVNETAENIRRTVNQCHLDAVQFHGEEPPEACNIVTRAIKALRVRDLEDLEPLSLYHVAAYLLDAYTPDSFGGTGTLFNWDIALEAKRFGPVILAGGLTPENVAQAVRHVRPYAVDVSSGVEARKGKKDHRKLRAFIERAKAT
ncbi:MAG: phosphoribosylanthranilate isomerase [Nitrospirota bacterium]|jgi:phosphoribosylanthranilate isomerase